MDYKAAWFSSERMGSCRVPRSSSLHKRMVMGARASGQTSFSTGWIRRGSKEKSRMTCPVKSWNWRVVIAKRESPCGNRKRKLSWLFLAIINEGPAPITLHIWILAPRSLCMLFTFILNYFRVSPLRLFSKLNSEWSVADIIKYDVAAASNHPFL